MTGSDRERLRASFTEDAELYDQARPGYPPELFDDLAELTGIGPGCRVLEVGPGTGQATVPLAERGCHIVAVELGAEMAALARRNLARFPSVQVVTAAFEDWPPPAEPFDVVVSATAFHWIDPAVRMVRAADSLRAGGALATIATHHIKGGSTDFFAEAQTCYERFDPATPPDLRLQPAAEIPYDDGDEPEPSGPFGPPVFRRHEWEQTYSTAEYLNLLRTYSNHRTLEPVSLVGLLDCLTRLINDRHGGQITKRYLSELRVARRGPAHDLPDALNRRG
ncbi:trans-aconitate 2-methyltransferase [Streptosporangium sp. 'caverna']|uniref:class I SAM-dependent methyltransferase n=1 Tax=Streptosporangium sp. 'caverna' TaxID=2202249 RepID=UPI000D7E326F|nr:class I SAM-dependent methyltransferase [Streptosporangium sp. 'caverna']AWS44314.1 SAM-dependent methyltransferase [Streptosporangium sp. 'caverna']